MVSESGVVVGVSSAASEDEGEVEGSVDWGSEAGRAAASVMGVSGESLAGSGGAGAWRVERQIALDRMLVKSRDGFSRVQTHHSRSSTERVSTTPSVPSLSSSAPSRCCDDEDPARLTTSVTSFNFSLASARLSAGFFAFGSGRRTGTGTACRFLRMQNIHKKGATIATTNTGIKKLNAVGVIPDWPTVSRHSRASRLRTKPWLETAGIVVSKLSKIRNAALAWFD